MTKEIEHEILQLLKPLDIFSKQEILERVSIEINNEEVSDTQRFIIQSKLKIQEILHLCSTYVFNGYDGKLLTNDSIKRPEVWLYLLDALNLDHKNFYQGIYKNDEKTKDNPMKIRTCDYKEFSSMIDKTLLNLVRWYCVTENLLAEFGLRREMIHPKGTDAFYRLHRSIEDCVFDQFGKVAKPSEIISNVLTGISRKLDELEDTIDTVLSHIKEPNSITQNALEEAKNIQIGKVEREKFSSSHELFKDVIYPAWIEQRLK